MHRIWGYTLGCRLNAYETEAILEEFRLRCGMERVSRPSEATLIIVNTCAVTGRSTARSRKAVRSFCRRTDASVVVTGCVAQIAPEEFDGQDLFLLVPNTSKRRLVEKVALKLGVDAEEVPCFEDGPGQAIFPACAPEMISRTRAFLKVQDGCDSRCTYCVVPAARGPSRSQPRELVVSQASRLSDAGFREILLTGVDLASYGRDLYGPKYGLVDLVRDLLRLGGFRLRLSSMEPMALSTEILERIALPGVCRHLHIPLQSGSDRILEMMGRKYSAPGIRDLLDAVLELFPGAAVGTDVIVGFPGESEDDFLRTLELLSHPAVSYLHVFPFSSRPGTPAASMLEEMVHPETVTGRARHLRALSEDMRRRFRESLIGSEVLALVESRENVAGGRLIGMTDNYIPVLSPEGAGEGDIVRMTLESGNICWDRR